MTPTLVIPVHEASQVGHARRTVASLVQSLRFNEETAGRAALIATELANNLVHHAKDGELILRVLQDEDVEGVELLSIDRGPGIPDVDRALQDGFSTGGTAGKGLGAIARMAHLFDLHSVPGKGTVVLAQLWGAPRPERHRPFEVGVVCLPMPGEEVAGDSWTCAVSASVGRFFVVDGLGHGLPASDAARAATETFQERPAREPLEQMKSVHLSLKSTRGAAGALAEINADLGQVRFSGVGNISATAFLGGKAQRMVSHNGTLGHAITRMTEFNYTWEGGALLVMHSDGLQTSWKLDAYQGLLRRHPGVIAATLYRDFSRGRDDVTVLVVRDRRGQP